MRTSSSPISGHQLLALVVCALLLGAVSALIGH
jgi:hypothetical protein